MVTASTNVHRFSESSVVACVAEARGGDAQHLSRAASTPCLHGSRLFREATQLKTAAAIVRVAGVKVVRTEIQVQPADAIPR